MNTRSLALVITVACVAGCTSDPPELAIVTGAIEAMGGRSRLDAVKTITMEGAGLSGNLGQNRVPHADDPSAAGDQNAFVEVTGFKRAIDFETGRARQTQTRTPQFASPNPQPNTQTVGLDGDVAFTIAASGQFSRQSAAAAEERRLEFLLQHPVGVLRAAVDRAATLANARQSGDLDLVDITAAQGDTVTLAVNRTSRLPASVSAPSYHAFLGDVISKTSFLDYEDVDGLRLPTRFVTNIDTWPAGEIRVRNTVNDPSTDMAAPAAARSAALPDSAAINIDVDQIGPGVWYLTGGSHNSVLVEFSDHTELIEVPNGDARTLAVIAKARELSRGKPLTKALVTHHHFDHAGGIRAAISEGLTLVTHEQNRSFFEAVAKRTHTRGQDALAKNPKPVSIEPVGDQQIVSDVTRSMHIYRFDDPTGHNDAMLMVFLPEEGALINADLYNWGGNFTSYPRALALNDNVAKRGLLVKMHLPIHGQKNAHSDFLGVVAALRAGRRPEGLRRTE